MNSRDSSRPPSPHPSDRPFSSSNNGGMGFFSVPFERFMKDEASDWTSAFTLLDTIETFFDSRMDLLERRIKKHSDRLKMKAEEAFNFKHASGDLLKTKDIEREVQKFKFKVSKRMASLSTAWQSAKVVRTREKITFFYGVMSLLLSALIFGMAPEWMHVSYTVQALVLLPMRAYKYKKRSWHYFLFDLCYYTTILNFVFIWLMPWSSTLWIACYCLSHGSLASAVITWRNSLVFHDSDKVTSLFVHIYAPLTLSVIRHYYPDPSRFPAVRDVPTLEFGRAIFLSSVIYVIWQALYWKFVLIDRRKKIESGERTTSFSWLLNDKRGVIGRMLSKIPQQYRELSFMSGQLVYGIVTELPAFVLYKSSFWSGVFLIFLFGVSVWNGGGFYIEVFGRKFERELEALRKELADSAASRSGASTPPPGQGSPVMHTRTHSQYSHSEDEVSLSTAESPVILAHDLVAPMPPVDNLGLGLQSSSESSVDSVEKKQQ